MSAKVIVSALLGWAVMGCVALVLAEWAVALQPDFEGWFGYVVGAVFGLAGLWFGSIVGDKAFE